MNLEFNKFQLTDDNTSQRDIRRANPPKSSLDSLDLATRHEIFFRKVEDQKSPKSLPGDNSQKHGDINQQNKVAKEQKEKSGTVDQSLTQTDVERVSQAETNRREGLVSKMDSAGIPERESSGSSWETAKSLFERSITQRAKETVGWAWQTLSEKSLPQRAKETVEWTWQNGVKALSWKNLRKAMVMYLAVSGPLVTDAVKIYGKNGCSIDSQLVFDEHPPEYNNARRIVETRFERSFANLMERYATDPCDEKYKEIRVTFNSSLGLVDGVLGGVYIRDRRHLFLQPRVSEYPKWGMTLESAVQHELTHIAREPIMSSDKDYPRSAVEWVEEALADYNLFIYGAKQDAKHIPVPPNFENPHQYKHIRMIGGFALWLDKEFPGFVDDINKIAQKKQIKMKDIENLTGEPIRNLWEEYKKINFTAEMSQFIEEQREKYLGGDQQRKGKEKKDEL